MADTTSKERFNWLDAITSFSLLICALCLIFIVLSLRPVAKWATYQSICIEQQSEKAPISWAVRKCNGRSKVYQVK